MARHISVILLAGLSLATVGGQTINSARYPVRAQIQSNCVDGQEKIEVIVTLDPGWELYSNPVVSRLLETAKTVLVVTDQGRRQIADVKYPKGEIKKDESFGEYGVYTGTVTLRMDVKKIEKEGGPLRIKLFVQPYDYKHGICCPSQNIILSLP